MSEKVLLQAFGGERQVYEVNGVRYIVSSRFADPKKNHETMRERVEKYVKSDFANLTANDPSDIITGEYVCSSASTGKEETSADENS